jgi:hypothetical protein
MIASQRPQTIGPAILSQGKRETKSLPTWSALIESPERADDSSPGSASLRAQPWVEFLKSPSADPEAARSAKLIYGHEIPSQIQHCFPNSQTIPHPKSTLAHPKSTVGLGCELLIWGKNGLRPPLSLTCYRPKSGPKTKESNQNQTAANQKIYSASPLIPASRSKCLLPFPSRANEEFQVKTRPISRHPILPYSTLCQPILPIFAPSFFTGHNQGSLFITIFRFKGIQSNSKRFKAIQRYLTSSFFLFLCAISKNPTPPRQRYSTPEGALELLWFLDVGPRSFSMGAFREDLRQALPAFANQCQLPPPPNFILIQLLTNYTAPPFYL